MTPCHDTSRRTATVGAQRISNLDISEGRGPTSRPRGLVILVHGTRISARLARKGAADAVRAAKGSKPRLRHLKWFDDGSLFRKRAINPADFETVSFAWSGRNSAVARDKAARALGAMLDQKASEQYDLIVLIGHSHGGNVILKSIDYASEDNNLHSMIHIITMGTTFIDIRWMKIEKLRVAWWILMSVIPLYFYLLAKLNPNMWYGISSKNVFDSIFLLLTGSCLVVPLPAIGNNFLRYIEGASGEDSSDKPDQLRARKYLTNKIPLDVIRSSYDEAHMVLSLNAIMAQILNILLLIFFEPFSKIMEILSIISGRGIVGILRWLAIIAALIITPLAIIYHFQIDEINLFSELFIYISRFSMLFSPLRLLYIASFAILGLPGAGLCDIEIAVDSVPDIHSRASVFTVTRRNPVFLAIGRHFLHGDEKCIDRVRDKLRQLSFQLYTGGPPINHAAVSIDD